MRLLVESLAELDPVDKPITAAELSGRWELLYTTVELFRASPFFQMVRNTGERKENTTNLTSRYLFWFGGENLRDSTARIGVVGETGREGRVRGTEGE